MKISDFLAQKDYFYLMHLSYGSDYRRKELWDFARQKGIIGLSREDVVNGDWPEVRDEVRNNLSLRWAKQFDMFCENISPKSISDGDIIVVMTGWDYVLGVGKVVGPHRYDIRYSDREEFFDHVRPIDWLIEYEYEKRKRIPRVVFYPTLDRVEKDSERWLVLSTIDFGEGVTPQTTSSKTTQSDADKLKGIAEIQTELTKETVQVNKVNRYRRSRELVEQMKQLYSYQCQLCSPETTSIPQIPMKNGNNYVEVHHIKGFNEIINIEGQYDQDQADYLIDHYKNTIVVCVYHHKLLHRHKDKFEYDQDQKCFMSQKDETTKIPLILNKHL